MYDVGVGDRGGRILKVFLSLSLSAPGRVCILLANLTGGNCFTITASIHKEPDRSPLHFLPALPGPGRRGCMQNFVLEVEVGGEAFPSILNWEPGVPCSLLNSDLIMGVQGSASFINHDISCTHACPTARLPASTPLLTPFSPSWRASAQQTGRWRKGVRLL